MEFIAFFLGGGEDEENRSTFNQTTIKEKEKIQYANFQGFLFVLS